MASHDEYYDESQLIPISSGSSSISFGDYEDKRVGFIMVIRRMVGATVAGMMVGGPLLVGMGIALAVSLSLSVIGFPLMLIFSPLLILPTVILVTCIAGFSVAAVMALTGISTLNWVFRSIRCTYLYGNRGIAKTAATSEEEEEEEEEEEDVAAEALAQGWKQQKQQKQEQGIAVGKEEEEEDRRPVRSTATEDSGGGEEGHLEQQEEDVTTVTPPKHDQLATPTTATATDTATDSSEKKLQGQKPKKQKYPKKK